MVGNDRGPIVTLFSPLSACRPVAIVLILGAVVQPCTAAEQDAPAPTHHVESTPTKHLSARLNVAYTAPQVVAAEWVLFAPAVPELPSQQRVSTRFGLPDAPGLQPSPVTDKGPLQRPFLLLRAPVAGDAMRQSVTTLTQYEADLCARKLVPGPPAARAPALPAAEREAYLASTGQTDHATETFRRWLAAARLVRDPQEDALSYAFRLFRYVRQSFRYEVCADRRASVTAATGRGDCGNLSILYVAALRANGIPARTLFGRWARPQEGDYGMWHVKPEFFVDGIGWVPAEPTGAIVWGLPDPDTVFGTDSGEFLAMHVDTDLRLDSVYWGEQSIAFTQFPLFYATGQGTLAGAERREMWQVETQAVKTDP